MNSLPTVSDSSVTSSDRLVLRAIMTASTPQARDTRAAEANAEFRHNPLWIMAIALACFVVAVAAVMALT